MSCFSSFMMPPKWRTSIAPADHALLRAGLALAICLTVAVPAFAAEPTWDSTAKKGWPPSFEKVSIPSTADGATQAAYIYKATGEQPRPLVVSLHTWSGGYAQTDPLAPLVEQKNWNYIHPDFRGPNFTPAACASKLAIQDVDDAIAYALANMPVDKGNIFVVGTSGGGHMACAHYLNTRHPVKMTFAWVPITDLEAWYQESRDRKSNYADHIFAATQSEGTLNVEEARARSPMFMAIPKDLKAPIRIFAGIDDGYTGSVPITHSLLFYNRLAQFAGGENLVPDEDVAALAAREKPGDKPNLPPLGKKEVLYHRGSKLASVTIFQGGHEMVVGSCFAQMEELADPPAAPVQE
jgi:acetyl esterase/lipase